MKQIFSIFSVALLLFASCDGTAQEFAHSEQSQPQTFCQTYRENPKRDRMLPSTTEKDQIVKHTYYTLSYSEADEQALWVAYMLTRSRTKGNVSRTDFFSADESVETGSASYEDYRSSGYTRGHLYPAADARWNVTAMEETFLMSNISPQLKDFNEGVWSKLEGKMRHWANVYDTIYIVTGPVLKATKEGAKMTKQIGKNRVSVPKYFYKAVYCPREQQAIGFLVPHEKSEASLQSFVVSIDQLEEFTGIDFFPELEDTIEQRIESSKDIRRWRW